MPKLAGHRPVFQVYGPKLRLKQFPKADWRFLVHAAGNVARAFAAMHACGLIVGDVNHGNLFVAADATVRFIDADSMQVAQGARRWPCEVGVGTHQPPEMQGLASYRGVVRTPNHDNFGLAVLIFQVLCMGRHPFSGRYAGAWRAAGHRARHHPVALRLQRGQAPHPDVAAAGQPGDGRPAPGAAARCSRPRSPPARSSGGRPTAAQWVGELAALGRSAAPVRRPTRRTGIAPTGACPWCEVEASSGVVLFPAVFVPGRGGGVALLWHEIEALPEPGPMPDLLLPDPASVQASAHMREAAQRIRNGMLLAAGVLVLGVALAISAVPSGLALPLCAVAAVLAAALWWLRRPREIAQARTRLAEARALWSGLAAAGSPARPPASRPPGLPWRS